MLISQKIKIPPHTWDEGSHVPPATSEIQMCLEDVALIRAAFRTVPCVFPIVSVHRLVSAATPQPAATSVLANVSMTTDTN